MKCVAGDNRDNQIVLPLPHFKIHQLDENAVLTTYRSEIISQEGTEIVNRGSIWSKADGT